jgi:hypothetical protein
MATRRQAEVRTALAMTIAVSAVFAAGAVDGAERTVLGEYFTTDG